MKIVANGSSNANTMSGANYALEIRKLHCKQSKPKKSKERGVNSNFCPNNCHYSPLSISNISKHARILLVNLVIID
jgi:hypothetical protein